MHPFYVIRAIGGLLFLSGAIVMAFNIWKTITSAAPEEAGSAAAPQPAE